MTLGSNSPVEWHFSIKKIGETLYRIEAKAQMDKGFHIWAMEAGGDGSLIPTSVTIEAPETVEWQTAWTESKAPLVQTLDFIDGPIRWHEQTVIFSRDFKGRKAATLKGNATFQACNDQMCFPPDAASFSLVLPE